MPVLSAANWAHHLHTRGNFEGYARAASTAEVARGARPAALGRVLHRLRGRACRSGSSATSSRARTPDGTRSRRCCCSVRHVDGTLRRARGSGWPLAADPVDQVLPRQRRPASCATQPDAARAERAVRGARRRPEFWTPPLEQRTGDHRPGRRQAHRRVVHARRGRVPDPAGRSTRRGSDVTFVSGQDPHGCVGFGWLRASHRKTDPSAVSRTGRGTATTSSSH